MVDLNNFSKNIKEIELDHICFGKQILKCKEILFTEHNDLIGFWVKDNFIGVHKEELDINFALNKYLILKDSTFSIKIILKNA